MDTLIGIVLAAAFVLPGFVTQELTVRRRPSARADGQTATQRALFYAVFIQLVWSWDTWRLAEDLAGGVPLERIDHLSGMWLSADRIEALFPLVDNRDDPEPDADPEPFMPVLSFRRIAVGWRSAHPKVVEATTDEVESRTAVDSRSQPPVVSPAGSSGDLALPPESGAQDSAGAAAETVSHEGVA
jgi:hypothetical protein